MNVDILICAYGDRRWRDLAWSRAYPSAMTQDASNVQVWYSEESEDENLAAIRNRAARASRADWLCFLDADDELAPCYLEAMRRGRLAAKAAKQLPALLVPAVTFVYPDGESLPTIPNRGKWPEYNECVIGTLVQRDLFLNVGGFNGDYRIYEDWALFLACERAGATRFYVEDAVYRAHWQADGRNTSATYRMVDYNEILRSHRAALAE